MQWTKDGAMEDTLTHEYFVMSGWTDLYTTVIMVLERGFMFHRLRRHK